MRVVLYIFCVFVAISSDTNGTDSTEGSTLTTAIVRVSMSPKPSADYRRINVAKDAVETSSTQFDLFEYLDAESNDRSYIWKWDHWCQLQPRKGNCEKNMTKFFYDAQTDQCKSFIYSGCDGNKNNFNTLLDCERNCKGANFMKLEQVSQPTFCYLQPDSGLCLAMMKMYYYDINEKYCKEFTYGGCGGNQNKFETKISCVNTCQDQT